MPAIELDIARCTGCGLCEAFCPVSVFDMEEIDGRTLPVAARPEECWACDTCVGQCPVGALHVTETSDAGGSAEQARTFAPPLAEETAATYRSWAETLSRVLRLRWSPVAISLIPEGSPMPDVPAPKERLRYCQSLMAARRGASFLMSAKCHACPDGTAILGLTEIPPKLASGELYILFKKLASIEAAKQMCAERPHLEPRSIAATLVSPLTNAVYPADVIAVIAQPEQMMWLAMSASFFTGKRFDFHVSGYNAQCVETTLYPYTTGELNISLGCYGCRASSDVSDDLMFMGIPVARMPELIRGLEELGKKAISDSRNKIYLSPLT
ncbi:MAG: 4Fe-4S dicluster domain-containing protein [Coriobacteriia bacterium]|nr:4Fe-4S dicluster domain-containing protein [Coriobacteriia bacterium]